MYRHPYFCRKSLFFQVVKGHYGVSDLVMLYTVSLEQPLVTSSSGEEFSGVWFPMLEATSPPMTVYGKWCHPH